MVNFDAFDMTKINKELGRLLNRTFEEQELAIAIDGYVSGVPWLQALLRAVSRVL